MLSPIREMQWRTNVIVTSQVRLCTLHRHLWPTRRCTEVGCSVAHDICCWFFLEVLLCGAVSHCRRLIPGPFSFSSPVLMKQLWKSPSLRGLKRKETLTIPVPGGSWRTSNFLLGACWQPGQPLGEPESNVWAHLTLHCCLCNGSACCCNPAPSPGLGCGSITSGLVRPPSTPLLLSHFSLRCLGPGGTLQPQVGHAGARKLRAIILAV